MDPDLVLIFAFIIIVTTILGLTVNGIVQKVLDFKRDQAALGKSDAKSGSQVSLIADRTAHIEDRLKVLERIATDPEARRGTELAQEIEQLREERENAQ